MGYPALFCELDPSNRSKPVQLSLLQEARAKLARLQVQSERPGLTAGAFAFGGVRTPFCDKGLRAWRSLAVAWPSAWPTVAEVSPGCLSGHRETFPRSGVSGERSRCVYVSRVTTADSGGS